MGDSLAVGETDLGVTPIKFGRAAANDDGALKGAGLVLHRLVRGRHERRFPYGRGYDVDRFPSSLWPVVSLTQRKMAPRARSPTRDWMSSRSLPINTPDSRVLS
jgi:hypothetical protein